MSLNPNKKININQTIISNDTSLIQTKLTLTRLKSPEFETNQRVCPARVKSAPELEEDMMAKMPKFKAWRLNKQAL